MRRKFNTVRYVELAILLAVVVVFQLFLGQLRVGSTNFSVVLVPIVIGSVLLGPWQGAFLGAAFGLITLFAGIFGTDPFTATLFQYSSLGTTLLCMTKATCAGLVPGVLYRWLNKKNEWLAVIVASLSAPIVNTGLFVLFASTLVRPAIEKNFDSNVLYFLVIVCAGVNFLVELTVNAVLSPVIYRVLKTFRKESNRK